MWYGISFRSSQQRITFFKKKLIETVNVYCSLLVRSPCLEVYIQSNYHIYLQWTESAIRTINMFSNTRIITCYTYIPLYRLLLKKWKLISIWLAILRPIWNTLILHSYIICKYITYLSNFYAHACEKMWMKLLTMQYEKNYYGWFLKLKRHYLSSPNESKLTIS